MFHMTVLLAPDSHAITELQQCNKEQGKKEDIVRAVLLGNLIVILVVDPLGCVCRV